MLGVTWRSSRTSCPVTEARDSVSPCTCASWGLDSEGHGSGTVSMAHHPCQALLIMIMRVGGREPAALPFQSNPLSFDPSH